MPLAPPLQQTDRTYVLEGRRKLIYFGGCDYFLLASHPQVVRALQAGADRFGLNVAASRSTTGNHALFGRLEEALAAFFGAESSLVTASGYATNLVVAQALAGEIDHALIDARSHGSVVDAMRFLGCNVSTFVHRDWRSLAAQVKAIGPNRKLLLATDGMFSHDGSAAPLRDYLRVLPRDVTVLLDDAHAAGVLGTRGQGTIEHEGVSRARFIQTVSLSKAFGTYCGAVLCSRGFRDAMIERSRLANGNTPLPLPVANAALAAVKLLARNRSWRKRLNANAAYVKDALRRKGIALPEAPGPIVAVIPADADAAERLKRALRGEGVFPSLIRYSGGPAEGYFRFMISNEHTTPQLDALVSGITAGHGGAFDPRRLRSQPLNSPPE